MKDTPSRAAPATDIIWRSAILPGWGQYHRGENVKAAVFVGLFAGSVYFTYLSNRHYLSSLRDLENMRASTGVLFIPGVGTLQQSFDASARTYDFLRFAAQERAVERRFAETRTAFALLAAVYLASLFDAAFIITPTWRTTNTQGGSSSRSRVEFTFANPGVAVTWRF